MKAEDKNRKSTRMSNRADRLTKRAEKITGKGSTSLNLVVGDKSASIKSSNNTKKSDRLLFRASVLKGKSISDPLEKARYVSGLPEGKLKSKITKRGPVQKFKDKRAFRKMM